MNYVFDLDIADKVRIEGKHQFICKTRDQIKVGEIVLLLSFGKIANFFKVMGEGTPHSYVQGALNFEIQNCYSPIGMKDFYMSESETVWCLRPEDYDKIPYRTYEEAVAALNLHYDYDLEED